MGGNLDETWAEPNEKKGETAIQDSRQQIGKPESHKALSVLRGKLACQRSVIARV